MQILMYKRLKSPLLVLQFASVWGLVASVKVCSLPFLPTEDEDLVAR